MDPLERRAAFPSCRVRRRARGLALALLCAVPVGAPAAVAGVEPPPPANAPAPPPAAAASTSPESASATDAFTEFRRAFDARRYEEAAPYARRVLQLAESQARSPTDEEVQVALMNLATTQYLAGDYVAAEASYQRVIELVEASGRPLHERLARAYAGLAATYHEGKRHDLAVKNFETAIALTRRHEGLLTQAQLPLLEKYIDSLTELGRYPDALQGWKYVLRIETRKYGTNGVELAPTLERIGRWYVQVGLYDQARRTFHRAIDVIEVAEGENSPKLIGPLTALAQCNRRQLVDPNQQLYESPDTGRATMYHEQGMMAAPAVSPSTLLADGERALQRAAAIADARADPAPVQVADVRTQLGDWYLMRGAPGRALENYQRAWRAAASVTQKIDDKPLTEALFGKPVLLQLIRPEGWNRYGARPPDQVETRNVVLEFTVTAEGAAEGPKVIDDGGDPKRAEKTREALRTARYRPRFELGQPVATTGVTLSQPWIILLPEQPKEGAPPAQPADSSTPEKAAAPVTPPPT